VDVVSTVNLAHPNGGPPLPAGTPVSVDENDEFIKGHIDGGYLIPVKAARGERPTWDENAPIITSGTATDSLGEQTTSAAAKAAAKK
jgi:hypothetical protein